MKKLFLIVLLTITSNIFAGPVVEIFECQINKGKSLEDLSNMMDSFSEYLKKAGRSEERRVGKECRSRWSAYH